MEIIYYPSYILTNTAMNEIQLKDRYVYKVEINSIWICPYISRHLLSLNPLLACCRRYSRGER